jgi:hypothetical protein
MVYSTLSFWGHRRREGHFFDMRVKFTQLRRRRDEVRGIFKNFAERLITTA